MPNLDTIDELLDRGGTAGAAMSNMNTTEGVFKWAGRWSERYKQPEEKKEATESSTPSTASTVNEASVTNCSITEPVQD